MRYNFDQIILRENTDATKIESLLPIFGKKDLIPLWIADMDFATPHFIIENIFRRLNHPIIGYTVTPKSYFHSIQQWLKKRYQWSVQQENIHFVPGVVSALAFGIQCFTQPNDTILIQPPVYHPFKITIQNNGRRVINNPLLLQNGQYCIDFEEFRKAAKQSQLFLLCNPHNPGGRVWTKDELVTIAEICHETGTLVIADEIHADLTLPSYQFFPFASVSEKAASNSITFMAASKAFNIPGLSSAYAIIPEEKKNQKFSFFLQQSDMEKGHFLAFRPVESAYTEEGEAWLQEVLHYIVDNINFVETFLKEYLPTISIIRPQASYLIFLDCRALQLPHKELVRQFIHQAGLALNDGQIFGEEGIGFMRLNVAVPRKILEKAMQNIQATFSK